MKQRILLFLAWILLLPGYGFCGEHTLLILHTNDFHGHLSPWVNKELAPPPQKIGGSAYMAALIRKYREKNPRAILLDAGDIAQGTMVSNLFKGAPVVSVMNAMRYDAGAVGNHEFDWGLPATFRMIKEARFPVLCANVRSRATGKLLPGTRPYVILQEGDIKIGIIGLITTDTPQVTHPKNVKGLEFLPPIEVVRRYYPIVKSHGADLVIALSHCGLAEDRQIAGGTNLLDAIIGGHSHTELREALKEGSTIIVQAGCYGSFVGALQLMLDENKKIRSYEYRLVPVLHEGLKPDPIIAGIVKKYEDKVSGLMNKNVGETLLDLVRDRRGESNIGDLIADAMREHAKADVAFHNSGGIRADIYRGPVTAGAIFSALPFENVLTTTDLTGAQVLEVLRHGFSGGHGSVQLSGIRVIKRGEVLEATIGGKPLEEGRSYRVVTNDFMAAGGDGYETFKKGRNATYGDLLRDVVSRYIRTHSPIRRELDGRIRIE